MIPTLELASKLIAKQFPEYRSLPLTNVEKQGHDNRTYKLGSNMLIRMPTTEHYALKIPIEQKLLQKLAPHLTIKIPTPMKMGKASQEYPYPFSLYNWLPGKSINLLSLTYKEKEHLAFDLATFLRELQSISTIEGILPGQHNWWRGDHLSIYSKDTEAQIAQLTTHTNSHNALALWNAACKTKWNKQPVWIHGDIAIGNMLMNKKKLSAIIDFGCTAIGDPACDLVIAWTYFSGKSRTIFISEMNLDANTWLRARAWALWKSTFELCQIKQKTDPNATLQTHIIEAILHEYY